MYMHGKKLKWARHVIRMFDNRMPTRIMKGSVGGRRPAGRSRNRCSRCGCMPSDWLAASRHRSYGWRKAREIVARKRGEKS